LTPFDASGLKMFDLKVQKKERRRSGAKEDKILKLIDELKLLYFKKDKNNAEKVLKEYSAQN